VGRYEDIPEKKNDTNKRVRRSTLMPSITPSLDDIYIITTPGDRLDLIAYRYYGNVSYWWIIAQANPESNVGKGTMVVPLGIQLRIPTNTLAIIDQLNELNSN
jgi:phage tail protein X